MTCPRVLVIDDSTSICFFISTTLRKAGYEVAMALNGQEGLNKLMTFHPHCLILDVILPDISGYEICRYLRRSLPKQKLSLILISAKSAPLDVSYGLRQGADRYLPKPFTAEDLLREVRGVIPEHLRSTVPPASSPTPQQPAVQEQLELIPRRISNQGAMQTSSPFARNRTPIIRDEQARRIYTAIDGKKTVIKLAAETGLETEEVISALRVLLKSNSIEIDSPAMAVSSMVASSKGIGARRV